jgi:AraC family transcriptional regulator
MSGPIIARGSLAGRPVHHGEAGGFVFTETRHRPLLSLPRHANDRATLVAVLGGDYEETGDRRAHRHAPGSLILRPPGHVHSNSIGPRGASCLLIELTDLRFDSLRRHGSLFDGARALAPGGATGAAVHATRELAASDQASSLVLESLALEMLGQFLRQPSRSPAGGGPSWLPAVRELLDVREGEAAPSLARVARAVNLHPVYLARAFRSRLGCSVGEYARRRRVAWACERLAGSDRTLAEIAGGAGFHDQSHFSRVFRRHTGMTPAGFRRATRQGSADARRVRGVLDVFPPLARS